MGKKEDFRDKEDFRSMEELHESVLRKEEQIPEEGNERGPWWMYAIIIGTLAFGFFYMGRYLGEISHHPHVLFTDRGPAVAEEAVFDPMETGRRVYTRVCQACHQQNGAGVAGAFPPLAGSEWVSGDPQIPVLLVLHGLEGEIVRNGTTYNAPMPGFGRLLSDEEIAGVVTYIRNSFGNEASEVTPEDVEEIRADASERQRAWTENEVEAFMESRDIQ
ncbi:cytochrome c [Balneolaceae bacterium ANBcel3]|nr:cytochrome c [Balneolaceae bacterium ANBcel3]